MTAHEYESDYSKSIKQIESGRHLPSMSTLKKLAKATGTKLTIHLEQV